MKSVDSKLLLGLVVGAARCSRRILGCYRQKRRFAE